MMELHFAEFWDRLSQGEYADLVPEWVDDQQARSRGSRDRIMHVTHQLLEEKEFSEISLKEVAEAAELSVGAVYARFPSKEAILFLLGAAVLDGSFRRFEKAMSECGPELEGLAQAYVATLAREFIRYRGLIREMRRYASGDLSLSRLLAHTNRSVHQTFLAPAVTLMEPQGAKVAEKRLNYALFAVNAAAREAVLAGALSAYAVEGSEPELVEELTRLMTAYLTLRG